VAAPPGAGLHRRGRGAGWGRAAHAARRVPRPARGGRRRGRLIGSRLSRLAAALLLAGLLLALDHGSKSWAAHELSGRGSRSLLGGHLVLRFQRNSGIAFGLFRAERHPKKGAYLVAYESAMVAGVALLLAVRLLRREPAGRLVTLGLVGLLAGAAGNLVDRARTATVIDFIDVRLGGGRWPAFNLADAYLAAGVGLCVVGLVAGPRRGRPAAAAGAGRAKAR
jgi:lipoprotein signal peptidase